MFVRVVLLRERGRRLSAEEVRAAQPLQGCITVCKEPARRLPLGQWQRVAMLMPHADAVEPLAELYRMRLHHWGRRGLVLSGVEEVWNYRRSASEYRQAWWVQFPAASGQGFSPVTPAEQDRLVEEIVRRLALRLGR